MANVAMIHYDRWRDGLRYPATIVREERRFSAYGSCAAVPPIPPFERVEEWVVCARNEQEAHKTVAYHFGRTLVRYALGEPTKYAKEQPMVVVCGEAAPRSDNDGG